MKLRRRRRAPRPGHLVTFGPVLALPAWGWVNAGPLLAGALFLAALLAWPPLVVLVLFGLPGLPGLLVPRSWRIAHRRRHGRENCRSARIPEFLRQLVFAADRHRCVYCGNQCLLPGERQADHFRPWSQGGLTTLLNLLTLCKRCNTIKSNYWPGAFYRPFDGADNPAMAADILRTERVRRLDPRRLVRVAWALG